MVKVESNMEGGRQNLLDHIFWYDIYRNHLFQFHNKDQLYEHLLECDVIVYDITEDPDQIDEAVWAVSGEVQSAI